MKEINEEARDRYYKEVSRRLSGAGFEPQPQEDGLLPVDWEGSRLCRVTAGGGAQFREEHLEREGGRAAFDRVTEIAATTAEYMRLIHKTFQRVPFRPKLWRENVKARPETQGVILGCESQRIIKNRHDIRHKRWNVTALVDSDDIHVLMIGASGIGKTAYFLYPNLEYACASGMSFLALDTKGDLARNYGAVAMKYYGYKVAVIDLRNPTRSDGYNLLTLINHYMDKARASSNDLAARAKAEKYAKILAKTIINPEGDASQYGQNAYFYDAAEGLLTAVVLVMAEYLPPTEADPVDRRHIVSVFKLIQEMLEPPANPKDKDGFAKLMALLPETHKAKWFAGAALNSADRGHDVHHVHGAFPPQRFPGLRAGAGAVLRQRHQRRVLRRQQVGHLPHTPGGG